MEKILFLLVISMLGSTGLARPRNEMPKPGIAIISDDAEKIQVFGMYHDRSIMNGYCEPPVADPLQGCLLSFAAGIRTMGHVDYFAVLRNALELEGALRFEHRLDYLNAQIARLENRVEEATAPELKGLLEAKLNEFIQSRDLQLASEEGQEFLRKQPQVALYHKISKALPLAHSGEDAISLQVESEERLRDHGITEQTLADKSVQWLLNRPYELTGKSFANEQFEFEEANEQGMLLAVVSSRYQPGAVGELRLEMQKDRKTSSAFAYFVKSKKLNTWPLPASFQPSVQPNMSMIEYGSGQFLIVGKDLKNNRAAYCKIVFHQGARGTPIRCVQFPQGNVIGSVSSLANGNLLLAAGASDAAWLSEFDPREEKIIRLAKIMEEPFGKDHLLVGLSAHQSGEENSYLVLNGGRLNTRTDKVESVTQAKVIGLTQDWQISWENSFDDFAKIDIRSAAVGADGTLLAVGDGWPQKLGLKADAANQETNFALTVVASGQTKVAFEKLAEDGLKFVSVGYHPEMDVFGIVGSGFRGSYSNDSDFYVLSSEGTLLGQYALHNSRYSKLHGNTLAPTETGFLIGGIAQRYRTVPNPKWNGIGEQFFGVPKTIQQPYLGWLKMKVDLGPPATDLQVTK